MIVDLPRYVFVSLDGNREDTDTFAVTQQFETGPPEQRAIQNLDSESTETFIFIMTKEREGDFKRWFLEDCVLGMELIRVPHPVTGNLVIYKIMNDNFSFTALGLNNVQVEMQLRSFYDQ